MNETICSESFKLKHRLTPNSFQRNRKLSFPVLVSYFLNLNKGSYQQELDNYFAVFNPSKTHSQVVTKSALTQARKHLSHRAFIELNHQLVDHCYTHQRHLKTWNGYRLCAIDGSQIRVPNEPEIVAQFGVNPGKPSQKDCPLALASVYYDVLNQISIDYSINPTKASERECAAAHLDRARPNDLVILDRGYDAFWLLALLHSRSQAFCVRVKANQGKVYKQFVQSGKTEQLITLNADQHRSKQCQAKGLPTKPLNLRLVRVDLKDEVEVLITNLTDIQAYPARRFKHLYHLRWGVEENYKRLKQWVEIENFSGKSALSVKQDFYAKVLSSNLTTILVNAAQKRVNKRTDRRTYRYQVNFAQALSKMKNTIVQWLQLTKRALANKLDAFLDYLACSTEPVRGGRNYPRIKPKPMKRVFYGTYKRAR